MLATMSSSIYTTAASRHSSSDEYLSFLDYPHAHDPTNTSDIAALSTDLLRQLPIEAQNSLWLQQESTSVVYASYIRLQDLLDEKFERLSCLPQDGRCRCTLLTSVQRPLTDNFTDSEHAFATYVNQLNAERGYLLHDAYPDWTHKLSMIRLDPYLDLKFKYRTESTTVRDWFTHLQDSVTQWAQEVRATEAPDFNDTVSEYTSQSITPTSIASSDSLAKALGMSPSLPKSRQTTMEHGIGSGHVENVIETRQSCGTQAKMS